MRIRTEAEYALRCLIFLAEDFFQEGTDARPVSVTRMAKREKLSRDYVEQIFLRMRRSGLVKSTRGVQGGYLLAKAPGLISVLEVFIALYGHAFEGPCGLMGRQCGHKQAKCSVASLWDNLGSEINEYLGSQTLEDLCAE